MLQTSPPLQVLKKEQRETLRSSTPAGLALSTKTPMVPTNTVCRRHNAQWTGYVRHTNVSLAWRAGVLEQRNGTLGMTGSVAGSC